MWDELVHAEGVGLSSGRLGSEALAARSRQGSRTRTIGVTGMSDQGDSRFSPQSGPWSMVWTGSRGEFPGSWSGHLACGLCSDAPSSASGGCIMTPHVVAGAHAILPGIFPFLGPAFLGEFYRHGLCEPWRGSACSDLRRCGGGFRPGGVVDEAGFFSHLVHCQKWAFARASLGQCLRRPSVVHAWCEHAGWGSEPTDAAVSAALVVDRRRPRKPSTRGWVWTHRGIRGWDGCARRSGLLVDHRCLGQRRHYRLLPRAWL